MVGERPAKLSDVEREIYRRTILIPEIGESGQLRLLRSRVLIVGLGGLGSPALAYLAAGGVGEIGIADCDRVELSNLQRQILHGREDVGRAKTASAERTALRLRPDLRLRCHPHRITADTVAEVIAPYDFVIEATDNFETKFLINDACVAQGKAFSHAGIQELYGQTMTVVPGRGPCFRCVFEEIPAAGAVPVAAETGVLGSVPGVLGALQATEALKYLTGCGTLLVGRLLTFDARTMIFRDIALPADRRCPLCRSRGAAVTTEGEMRKDD